MKCNSCNEPYNLENRSPYKLSACSHTICQQCFQSNLTEDNKIKCKECSLLSPQSDIIPDNEIIKTLSNLNKFIPETKCNLHNKSLEVFCSNDKDLLCIECVISSEHQGHQIIKLENAYKDEINFFKEKIDSVYNKESVISKYINIFDEKVIKTIDSFNEESNTENKFYDEILAVIKKRKEINEKLLNDIKEKILKFYNEQKDKLVKLKEDISFLKEQNGLTEKAKEKNIENNNEKITKNNNNENNNQEISAPTPTPSEEDLSLKYLSYLSKSKKIFSIITEITNLKEDDLNSKIKNFQLQTDNINNKLPHIDREEEINIILSNLQELKKRSIKAKHITSLQKNKEALLNGIDISYSIKREKSMDSNEKKALNMDDISVHNNTYSNMNNKNTYNFTTYNTKTINLGSVSNKKADNNNKSVSKFTFVDTSKENKNFKSQLHHKLFPPLKPPQPKQEEIDISTSTINMVNLVNMNTVSKNRKSNNKINKALNNNNNSNSANSNNNLEYNTINFSLGESTSNILQDINQLSIDNSTSYLPTDIDNINRINNNKKGSNNPDSINNLNLNINSNSRMTNYNNSSAKFALSPTQRPIKLYNNANLDDTGEINTADNPKSWKRTNKNLIINDYNSGKNNNSNNIRVVQNDDDDNRFDFFSLYKNSNSNTCNNYSSNNLNNNKFVYSNPIVKSLADKNVNSKAISSKNLRCINKKKTMNNYSSVHYKNSSENVGISNLSNVSHFCPGDRKNNSNRKKCTALNNNIINISQNNNVCNINNINGSNGNNNCTFNNYNNYNINQSLISNNQSIISNNNNIDLNANIIPNNDPNMNTININSYNTNINTNSNTNNINNANINTNDNSNNINNNNNTNSSTNTNNTNSGPLLNPNIITLNLNITNAKSQSIINKSPKKNNPNFSPIPEPSNLSINSSNIFEETFHTQTSFISNSRIDILQNASALFSLYKDNPFNIYLIGGKGDTITRKISLETMTWSPINSIKIDRSDFVLLHYKEKKSIILGGKQFQNGIEKMTDSIDLLNFENNRIDKLEFRLKNAKIGFGGAILFNKIFICGGYDGKYVLDSIECFDTKSKKWKDCARMSNKRRDFAYVQTPDNSLYVLGGQNDKDNILKNVERYDAIKNNWTVLKDMNQKRKGASAIFMPDGIYVIGGFDGSQYLRTCEKYDFISKNWSFLKEMRIPKGYFSLAPSADFQFLFTFGGFNGRPLNIMEKYDVINNCWEVMKDLPSARYKHSSIFIKE